MTVCERVGEVSGLWGVTNCSPFRVYVCAAFRSHSCALHSTEKALVEIAAIGKEAAKHLSEVLCWNAPR